jgi:hypothetical protein
MVAEESKVFSFLFFFEFRRRRLDDILTNFELATRFYYPGHICSNDQLSWGPVEVNLTQDHPQPSEVSVHDMSY